MSFFDQLLQLVVDVLLFISLARFGASVSRFLFQVLSDFRAKFWHIAVSILGLAVLADVASHYAPSHLPVFVHAGMVALLAFLLGLIVTARERIFRGL